MTVISAQHNQNAQQGAKQGTQQGADTQQNQHPTAFIPRTIGVVGLGLIGGSFAKAFAAAAQNSHNPSHSTQLYIYERNPNTRALALDELGCGTLTPDTIPFCELIILALYPHANQEWLVRNAQYISPDALVIDTAGVKRATCDYCFSLAKNYAWHFIGCHPMAGTQYSGFAHARANMFNKAPMVVCCADNTTKPQADTHTLAARLRALLEPCGFASYCNATPQFHDQQIAYTSQLAHVVSNAYVKSPAAQMHKGFSAGSYKDLTRVARLNPVMWCELFMDNRDNLSHEIDLLIHELARYKQALDDGDAETLTQLLEQGDALKRQAERKAEHSS